MSEEKNPQSFSIDTPDGLIRTLGVVRLLIDGIEEEIAKVPMTGSHYSFQEALHWAQQACPKVDWIRRARVSWLSRGMHAWEEELARLQEAGVSLANHHSPYHFGSSPYSLGSVGLIDHQTFNHFIAVGYIGIDCNAVMDKYLALLQQRAAELTGNGFWQSEMALLIQRRTGCRRDDDPHRDEAACRALLLQYGLEEYLPELEKSRPKPQRTA